ncbi:MAG: zinc ribbon domain-containing protein [Thermodesulfobacteriota bacterium]
MPIYEYRCDRCGREFEEWQKFSDLPVETCTACGGSTHRLISQSTFILKGTGWYVTDYARHDKNSRAGAKPKEDTTSSSTSSD